MIAEQLAYYYILELRKKLKSKRDTCVKKILIPNDVEGQDYYLKRIICEKHDTRNKF